MLHTQIPFTSGGAEVLVSGLVNALKVQGYQAEVVALPLRWNPPDKLLATAVAWRMLDLTEVAGETVDAVICTKFPTWAVRHPNKVLWLVHQHRQAYDLHGTRYSEFGPDSGDSETRSGIAEIDRVGIGECKRRFAISKNVAARLSTYCGISADVLYPPVQERDLWPESFEPFVLSAARLDDLKRVGALIEAWPQVDPALSLKITSDGPLRNHLEHRVFELGLSERVEFLGRVTDEELARLFRTCRAVYYAPVDEDYGYTAVESLTAGKPVITAKDSGGVLEFVDDETGIVSSLEPDQLAAALSRYADQEVARKQGENGRVRTSDISWDNVIIGLLGTCC